MSTPNHIYWHALNTLIFEGLCQFLPAARQLGGPENLYHASENRLVKAGLNPALIKKIIPKRININPAVEFGKLTKSGIITVCIEDKNYPKPLREIPCPPPILYVRGNPDLLLEDSLGVVGSRKISGYGKDAVKQLVPDMVSYGLAIVSGMAFGVDAAALNSCIESGGRPVSVLASSLDFREISPRSHLPLAKRIIEKGCLISENPPGKPPHKLLYPLRNRIISGLSKGVVLIEAAMESGSLITAKYALEQNREIFCVPGPIFSGNSSGTNELIKQGAKCVTSFHDIAREFGWDLKPVQQILEFDNELHQNICSHLAQTPLSINDLVSRTGFPPDEILAAATELEIKGILRRSFDGMYAKIK